MKAIKAWALLEHSGKPFDECWYPTRSAAEKEAQVWFEMMHVSLHLIRVEIRPVPKQRKKR